MKKYTPEIENRLMGVYSELMPNFISQLNQFINYANELSDLVLEEKIDYINLYIYNINYYYPNLYGECEFNKEGVNEIEVAFRNATLSAQRQIIEYLDSSSPNHQRQVKVKDAYWKRLLIRAKRQYLIKELEKENL